jgi:hypothetical protein
VYGRDPKTLFAVFANALPGKDDEYNHWCDQIHIPDAIQGGLFYTCHRYRAVGAGGLRYMNLWESDRTDLRAGMEQMRPHAEALKAQGRIWPVFEVVWSQVLTPVAAGEPNPGTVKAVTTVQNDWREPLDGERFEAWYGTAGLDVAAVAARYHSTYRYESYDGSRGRFLSVCESEGPVEALAGAWDGVAEAGTSPFARYATIFEQGHPPEPEEGDPLPGRPGAAWAAHWEPLLQRGTSGRSP